jgi:hypothetical protein
MSIYNRDQIPYSTMIQNAIANRNAAAQRDASYISNFGKIIGGAVDKVGNQIGRGIAVSDDEDEAELARLKKLKDELEQAEIAKKSFEEEYRDYNPIPVNQTPTNYTPFETTLNGYNVNANITPDYSEPNQYLSAINQYYRRGR